MKPIIKIKAAGEYYTYDQPKDCLVGRDRFCDIEVPNRNVSRHHCMFRIEPPLVWLRDLDSTNGTFVNDNKIMTKSNHEWIELHEGDEVRVGPLAMQIAIVVQGEKMDSDMFAQAFSDSQWN